MFLKLFREKQKEKKKTKNKKYKKDEKIVSVHSNRELWNAYNSPEAHCDTARERENARAKETEERLDYNKLW